MNENKVYLTSEQMIEPLAASIGKKITKIGMDKFHNTCRIVLDDWSMIFAQSVSGEEYLLKHGVCIGVETGEKAKSLSESQHMVWANATSAPTRGENPEQTNYETPASRELGAAPCSAVRDGNEKQNIELIIGDDLVTITVQKTPAYLELTNKQQARYEKTKNLMRESGIGFEKALGQIMKEQRDLEALPSKP